MTSSLRHRGPDDEGYLLFDILHGNLEPRHGDDTVSQVRSRTRALKYPGDGPFHGGFGWRRLAIIDPSPGGHQPMTNEDGSLWLIYNGEIYNYRELRKELEARGHQFRTASDSEVILHAYEEWKEECMNRFNGMWGFAIWDKTNRALFCARDRFGVKPFYYRWDGKTLIFASEIKAILQHPAVRRSCNFSSVHDYLLYGLTDHSEETFFEGIKQIPPGHYLTLDAKGNLETRRYYRLAFTPELGRFDAALCEKHASQVAQLFFDAVRLRLRTDVPIGSCLSGGLDSSSIVTVVNRLMTSEREINPASGIGEHLNTFSAAYADPAIDERRFIQKIADETRCSSHVVFPEGDRLWEEIRDVVWHQDEPFGSTSIYAQWNVMRLSRQQNVTVLLDGQGGDELLAGYEHYYPFFYGQLFKHGRYGTLLREIAANQTLSKAKLFRMASFFLARKLGRLVPSAIVKRKYYFDTLQPDILKGADVRGGSRYAGWNLQERLWDDVTSSNLQQLLRYEDRNSMAFSIEARVPFLDYRLVEYVMNLPAVYKIHDGWTKFILRRALGDVVPPAVLWRRDKIGFATPETHWLRSSQEHLRRILLTEPLRSEEFVNPRSLKENFDLLLFSKGTKTSEFWRILSLELWMRVFEVSS